MPSDQEPADDLGQSYRPPLSRRRIGIGLSIAAGAYALALAMTLPAAAIIHPASSIALSGSIWHGKASLPGNSALVWTANPLRSLAGLTVAVDWTLRGPDSEISGQARLRPHSIVLDRVSGQTGAGLLLAFFPEVTLQCQGAARVDLRHISVSRTALEADGDIRSTEAVCAQPGTDPRSIPPLVASFSSAGGQLRAQMAAQAAPENGLATASLEPNGKLIAEVRPQAASIIPGLPQLAAGSGPFRLETTLSMP
jgi:hypothetical protein